ncbi:MAG: hypothetical protein IJW73_04505 [Candidatus Gastranaerophilales bacterium]|nr:hypothetical protein [Candidatus Gastranaerophilales bacterium]
MAKVVLVGYGKMLYSLIEGVESSKHEILGVLRNDRVKNSKFELFFKDIFNPSQDYTIIKSKKLFDIKAPSVNSKDFCAEIQRLTPDLIIFGSWGEKFRRDILNLVPCVNFHPALLPKNRGANPYFWAIYLNQKVTGLTAHFMDEKFDKGDIILQEAITIDDFETGMSLKDKATRLARGMVGDLLDLFDKNQIQPIKQQEEFASYEPQLTEKELLLDLTKPKEDVDRHIRALYPWSEPYVRLARRYVKIPNSQFLEVDEKNKDKKPYTIIENNREYFILKGSDFLIKVHKNG